MYAIVGVAGFQYKMSPDEIVRVPLMASHEPGQKVTLDNVLYFSDDKESVVGQPTISGASVEAEILSHGRTKKQVAGKFKRRKDYRRRWGFRAEYTEIKVGAIKRG